MATEHVNPDWFAFTAVFWEMYLNDRLTPYAPLSPNRSWLEPPVVALVEQKYSKSASGHYVAETKLSLYMNRTQAPAPAARQTHPSTTDVGGMWKSYLGDGKR